MVSAPTSSAVRTSASLPLAQLSVVECGQGVAAALAAKLFALWGARVIKVEPHEGDVARRRGPFPNDIPDPDQSGLFLYLNADKLGVTLDLQQARDRRTLDALLSGADILLHNVAPGQRAACGMESGALCERFPGLIVTAISAFGGFGPRAHYHAYELNAQHACGLAALTPRFSPFPELPPVKFCGHQAELHAGLHAAIATLGACWHRMSSGTGQAIDVSEQECIAPMLSLTFLPYEGLHITRLGGRANVVPWGIFECTDGQLLFACGDDGQWQRLVELMGDPEWGHDQLFKDRESRFENQDALNALLGAWTKTQPTQELWRESQRRRIPAAPVNRMGQVYADEQFTARNFFVPLPGMDRSGRTVLVPGVPIKSTAMAWRFENPAPRLGEHNREVLTDVSPANGGQGRPPYCAAHPTAPERAGPLAGQGA